MTIEILKSMNGALYKFGNAVYRSDLSWKLYNYVSNRADEDQNEVNHDA